MATYTGQVGPNFEPKHPRAATHTEITPPPGLRHQQQQQPSSNGGLSNGKDSALVTRRSQIILSSSDDAGPHHPLSAPASSDNLCSSFLAPMCTRPRPARNLVAWREEASHRWAKQQDGRQCRQTLVNTRKIDLRCVFTGNGLTRCQ